MTSTLEIETLNFLKFLYWKLRVLDENVGYFSYKTATEWHLASHHLCKSHPMTFFFKKKKKQGSWPEYQVGWGPHQTTT